MLISSRISIILTLCICNSAFQNSFDSFVFKNSSNKDSGELSKCSGMCESHSRKVKKSSHTGLSNVRTLTVILTVSAGTVLLGQDLLLGGELHLPA